MGEAKETTSFSQGFFDECFMKLYQLKHHTKTLLLVNFECVCFTSVYDKNKIII